jgi:hypothetical protein
VVDDKEHMFEVDTIRNKKKYREKYFTAPKL